MAGAGKPPDGHPLGDAPPPSAPFATPVELSEAQAQAQAAAAGQAFAAADPNQPPPPPPPPQANDFRARFHRSLVAPSPFRTFAPPQPVAVAPTDGIDPHLGAADQPPKTAAAVVAGTAIDPELGQARGEAEGVVGRLERG